MTSAFSHEHPLRVYWEVTRACDLACRHCRATALPSADPRELSTSEGVGLLGQLAAGGSPFPHVVLTGGDPLKRADLFELIAAGREQGLAMSVAPSATPLLTPAALRALHAAGVDAISLSLDGSSPARHDGLRGVEGTFDRTLAAAVTARDLGLPFQVNTLVCRETVDALPDIYNQVAALGAARWSLFFLVSVGRGRALQPVTPPEAEAILSWAAALPVGHGRPVVTTTEAPQFRRIAIQLQREGRRAADGSAARSGHSHAAGIRDGNGILFISHVGDVCPSGFMEVPAGNVRETDVLEIYRTAPLFRQLRNIEAFTGRCGVCEYRTVCGGSRARSYAASGNPVSEDPLCAYVPRAR